MAQFIRTRSRCVVYPAKVGEPFYTVEGPTPKAMKGAGIEFEFVFLVDKETPFDVSNISSVTLMAKTRGSPSSAPVMSKTSVDIENIAELQTWIDGTQQHVLIVLSGTEMNFAAGVYDLTLYGVTSDDGQDTDVFGTSTLEVIDAGLSNITTPAVGASPSVTMDQLNGIVNQFVKKVMDPEATITFVSKNGSVRRILGVTDDHERLDDLEDV